MPRIVFHANAIGPGVTTDEPQGGALAAICDDAGAPVPFSCRGASCGTCRVDVVEGADLLDAPEEPELDLLDIFGGVPNQRLACCARVLPGDGLIRIRVAYDVSDDPTLVGKA